MADKSISGRHLHFPFNWGSQKIFSTTKGDSGKVERWVFSVQTSCETWQKVGVARVDSVPP